MSMDDKKRFSIQAASTLLHNANIKGFFTGRIYQGASKGVCVPGLNCYSCPGAVGACPIGSLQSFLGSRPVKIPYYIVGLLVFFGALLGLAKGLILCTIAFLFINKFFATAEFFQNSRVRPYFSTFIDEVRTHLPPDLVKRFSI